MKLSKLKYKDFNPRKISTASLEKLCNSISDFPKMLEIRPIVYDPMTMEVLGGNMRLKALRKLNYKECPDNWFIDASCLTDDEKHKFIVADNSSFGEWDIDLLKENWDLDFLENMTIDLPEEKLKKDVVETEDIGIQNNYDIKQGDIYKIGEHYLICGDSTKKDVLSCLDFDFEIGMVFSDPPYDMNWRQYQHNLFNRISQAHIFVMTAEKELCQIVNSQIENFSRLYAVDFRQANLVSNSIPMTRVDYIAEFKFGKTKFNNLKDGFSTLIECAKIHKKNASNFGHNQAKKVELPANFIQHFSNEKDFVVDYFGGSGTTMAACEQLGRINISVEYSPEFCNSIINRMRSINSEIDIVKVK